MTIFEPKKPLILLALLLYCGIVAAGEDKKELATQAAIDWLNLIDQKQHRESWKQAASLFKKRVGLIIWQQKMRIGREPLGNLVSRKPISASYATELPDAPVGEYVVIQFQTEFSKKAAAIETVTSMLDKRRWRVAGYYIR